MRKTTEKNKKMIDLIKHGTPLYLKPYREKKVWGVRGIGEYWYGAEAGEKTSLAVIRGSSMPMDRLLAGARKDLLGASVVKKFGIFLPLVKILTPKGRLSVQFHDKKNELWVVTDIDKEAAGAPPSLIVGFAPRMIERYGDKVKKEYGKALKTYGKALNGLIALLEQNGFEKKLKKAGNVIEAAKKLQKSNAALKAALEPLLDAERELDSFYHHQPVAIGDVIPVPQGTLHALGPGINIVEPQIPGPTQSLEDGATYPVRYYFPDYPCASGKKKLDLDRIDEINAGKWARGAIEVIERQGSVSVERLPGGFEEKGMQVSRIVIPARGTYLNKNIKSYHMLIVIKGKADALVNGRKFPIPKAAAGQDMLLIPASSGSFSIVAATAAQVLDIFTP
ncbi:MAG: hypothetical protein PHS37_07900 [Candidatus Omnitrophica bacterium]|nr:hypothetical protein [Candidatus Omnitrophota bacterium]